MEAKRHPVLRSLPAVVFMQCAWSVAPIPSLAQEADTIDGFIRTADPAVAALLSPFRAELDSAEVAKALEDRNRSNAGPRTTHQGVIAAHLWHRAGQHDQALQLLGSLPSGSPLVSLEKARILLEADSAVAAGVAAWWKECESMEELTRAEVYRDILPLTTPGERETWSSLEFGPPTCAWLKKFWRERAQRMAIPEDERLALHYRRLAHARRWYWIPRPRFTKSASDFHGRPDDLAMDDRGLIYVRMGPPLTSEGFATGSGDELTAGSAVEATATGVDPLAARGTRRCWPYWRFGGYRIFCFAQAPGRADGDYRIESTVAGAPGTRFFQQYVANSNLPASVIRSRVRSRGGGLDDPWERALDRVESRAWERHGVIRTRENIEEVLEGIPDVPDVQPTIHLRVETLRFLNPAEKRWQVWTLASVRAGDLTAAAVDGKGRKWLSAGGRFSVLESDGVKIRRFPTTKVAATTSDDSGIILKSVFSADPGRLPLTVVAEDQNAPGSGNWSQDTLNIPTVGGLPQLSDIAVAQAEGGTWTRDGETFLRVTPTHITNPDGTIHTYFEVYGVAAGAEYDVDLRLAPEEGAERIWRLQPDDLGFRLEFAAEMTDDIGRHHLSLDFSDTEPGAYTLAIRIQEVKTEAYSLPSVTEIFIPDRD